MIQCNHLPLLILLSFQTCMTYFLMRKTKENILRSVGNQTVWLPLDFIVWRVKKPEHYSKYHYLCSTEEEKSNMFGII